MENTKSGGTHVKAGKAFSLGVLFLMAAGIFLFGLIYGINNTAEHTSVPVLNMQMPGVVIGLMAAYLGVKYLLSVIRLAKEIWKDNAVFSWSNFRKKDTVS